ncbi:MAG: hypothetical protein AAF802_12445 [Planctomycetota bacterium]
MDHSTRPFRLSILIPFQRDQQLFEETLLSVLENRPESTQIIAVHNGTYSDPFDLGDEVDFATARSSNLVDLIRDGSDLVRGDVVHVLAPGFRALEGWAAPAIEAFEDFSVAAVDVLVGDNGTELAAGWFNSAGRLCQSFREVGEPCSMNGMSIRGVHLDAAFFRARVLRELLDAAAPAMNDPIACAFAFGCLLQGKAWKVASVLEAKVDASLATPYVEDSDSARGECLAAIECRVMGEPSLSHAAMIREAVLGWSSLGEWFGMMRYKSTLPAMRRLIDPDCVAGPSQALQANRLGPGELGAGKQSALSRAA